MNCYIQCAYHSYFFMIIYLSVFLYSMVEIALTFLWSIVGLLGFNYYDVFLNNIYRPCYHSLLFFFTIRYVCCWFLGGVFSFSKIITNIVIDSIIFLDESLFVLMLAYYFTKCDFGINLIFLLPCSSWTFVTIVGAYNSRASREWLSCWQIFLVFSFFTYVYLNKIAYGRKGELPSSHVSFRQTWFHLKLFWPIPHLLI